MGETVTGVKSEFNGKPREDRYDKSPAKDLGISSCASCIGVRSSPQERRDASCPSPSSGLCPGNGSYPSNARAVSQRQVSGRRSSLVRNVPFRNRLEQK